MGKQGKGKSRLDKYYRLAKEHGYRSRAAFKLIQLNKKEDFLSNSTCLIDLCAAPGGWLQVANKFMPISSIKIGFDLDKIKPIPGCKTFQCDITTPECLAIIKKEIKTIKADVVLHDGAPNVGSAWIKDAFSQSELVLSALKLAIQVLRTGGSFITKIFRSKDYGSLISALKKLFKRVIATKPKASRNESAEIFVMCLGLNDLKRMDLTFLDPKNIFVDDCTSEKVSSLKQLLTQKKHRAGYEETETGLIFTKVKLIDFIKSQTPLQLFKDSNEIIIDEESKEFFNKFPPPKNLEEICKDIQVLGRKEYQELLKWRAHVVEFLYQQSKPEKIPKVKEEKDEIEELEKMIAEREKKENKAKKRADQKQIDQMKKNILGYKDAPIIESEELRMDEDLAEDLKNYDIEELEYINLSDKGEDDENYNFEPQYEEVKESHVEDLNEEFEILHSQKNQFKKNKKQKESDQDSSEEFDDDLPIEKRQNAINPTENNHKEMMSSKLSGDFVNPLKSTLDNILQSEDLIYDNKSKRKKANINPIDNRMFKRKALEPLDEYFDDENHVPEEKNEEKSERAKKRELKKKRREEKRQKKENNEDSNSKLKGKQYNAGDITIVPEKEIENELNINEKAETVAIAKQMLRLKNREEIIDSTFNRFSFPDNDYLPEWFKDDQQKHCKPPPIVSEEAIEKERQRIKEQKMLKIHKRDLEYKARKRKKIDAKLTKLKSKANAIANQEDISESSKLKQIDRMYKKEQFQTKPHKKYVVAKKGFQSSKFHTHGKNVKFVDGTMKKEIRAKLRKEKFKKGRRHK